MAALSLLHLPLEIRHRIFNYAATRSSTPEDLLRAWFEKQEIKQLAAQHTTAHFNGTDVDNDDGEHGYDDYGNDDENSDCDSGDEDSEGQGDEGSDSDQQSYHQDSDSGDSDADDEVAQYEPVTSQASSKWRHIANFLQITHCPPPVELLLGSKQLNVEITDWFYDVAVLRVEATGSFAHTSFFEEAFTQISQAEFSPMQNIRKIQVIFAWDTTWLRAHTADHVEAIFPALLRQRSAFIQQILSQAPHLRRVTVHWHDSAQDEESANLKLHVLGQFDSLAASITAMVVHEHYIPADSKPPSQSIAGKRRKEFQSILDKGLDSLW